MLEVGESSSIELTTAASGECTRNCPTIWPPFDEPYSTTCFAPLAWA
jgi:hypothetical protein